MNRHLLLPAALAPLLFSSCDKPKPDDSGRISELEKRVAAAEQEAAAARAAQEETERLLEEQRLAVERDALERERLDLERQRAETERVQQEEARVAEQAIQDRESELADRESSAKELESYLAEQQKALDERAADLSERDKELAGREALVGPEPEPADPEPKVVNVNVFYDRLTPYGSWFDSPTYGYVWRPTCYNTAGWRPYSHGRWVCTDRGWMWVSDEPFGWATYHYGRWALCRQNGWIWIPGNEWAPSWVCWRTSGTHVGWAPLPPETMAYRDRVWDHSVELAFGIGSAWFCFVETRNFCEPIHRHCLPYTRNDYYCGQTRNVTNIYTRNHRVICGGPVYGDIARQTPRRPPFYRIEEDRHGRPATDRHYNRVEKGKIVVCPPRYEESRNPDAVLNRPSRISGRFDRVDVVRTKPLDEGIVRDFQRNREESRRPGAPPREIGKNGPHGKDGPGSDARGEEQRRLNEKAQDSEKEARKNNDDRIRVSPRPAGERPDEETRRREPGTDSRGEEPRRPNEKAQDLEKEPRKNVDDRIRVLPRAAEETAGGTSRPPTSPVAPKNPTDSRGEEQRRLNEKAQDLEKEARKNVDDRIRVLPRVAEETQGGNSQQPQRMEEESQRRKAAEEAQRQQQRQAEENARRQAEQQREQQRQAEEQQRRKATEDAQRQQQQRQAEENARRQAEQQREQQREQQQRQAEEQQRRRAAEEAQRQQQQRAAEESARRRAAEESQRQQQQRAAEENARRRAAEEAQRQQQQRQLEEQQRRNRR